jgi:hypothetical protein
MNKIRNIRNPLFLLYNGWNSKKYLMLLSFQCSLIFISYRYRIICLKIGVKVFHEFIHEKLKIHLLCFVQEVCGTRILLGGYGPEAVAQVLYIYNNAYAESVT